MTQVCNIYHYVAPGLGRTLAGLDPARWPDDCVYVGRKGHGHDGFWGNPVEIGKPCPRCGEVHGRSETIACYKLILWDRIENEPGYAEKVLSLHGKKLICFCAPKACHGDELAKACDILASKTV